MRFSSRAKIGYLLGCAGGVVGAPAFGQGSFHVMPIVLNAPTNAPAAVSADGSVVGGQVDGPFPYYQSQVYRYAIVGGFQFAGDLPGGLNESYGGGLSPNGVWAFGISNDGGVSRKPIRWSAATGIQALPLLPNGIGGSAAASSADGSIIVGSVRYDGQMAQAVRWTPAGVQAITGIANINGATGVSPDGQYVTGTHFSSGDRAFRWSTVGGLETLPFAAGVSIMNGRAISNDGTVIMGKATLTGTADDHYFRWTAATGSVLIMDMPGRGRALTSIWDMNADGSVAVGTSLSFINASNPDPERAVIWDAQHGVRDLNVVAAQMGINLQGYHLNGAAGISDDGLTITGNANLPNFSPRGYILRLAPLNTGACCMPDGTCTANLPAPDCASAGGSSWAPDTACAQVNCPSPGACCNKDGTCILSQPAACAAGGGTFAGAGVPCAQANCPPGGACCKPDGSCSIRTASACAADDAGIFRGAGVGCGSANCPTAYVYSGAAVQIPDGVGTVCGAQAIAAIVVSDSFTITSADASLFVEHTYQGDLKFFLKHVETGTTVLMVDRPGDPQVQFGFFQDNYGQHFVAPMVPFRCSDSGTRIYDSPPLGTQPNGSYNVWGLWKPENPLAPFVGENSAGTWQLIAQDCVSVDTGRITAWTLNLGKAAACYANCDGSTAAPALNVADFTCFLQKYAAGDPYANCDGSTGAPVLSVTDFTCFLQKFAAGCP